MKRSFKLASALLSVAVAASSVGAQVIDFNTVPARFQGSAPFADGPLTFAAASGVFGVWLSAPNVGPYNGTPYLLQALTGFSFQRTDLQPFRLNSFEMALGWYQPAGSRSVDVVYDLVGGGTLTNTLGLNDATFTTFTPGVDVTSVSFVDNSDNTFKQGYISMDNIDITSTVPEPSSIALVALGAAGLFAVRARRRV